MKLITQEIADALPSLEETAEYSIDDHTVHLKLFTPDAGATWHIVAGDIEDGMLFGLCDLGLGFPELGYVSLEELKTVRGKLGLPVERDKFWSATPLREVMDKVGA